MIDDGAGLATIADLAPDTIPIWAVIAVWVVCGVAVAVIVRRETVRDRMAARRARTP